MYQLMILKLSAAKHYCQVSVPYLKMVAASNINLALKGRGCNTLQICMSKPINVNSTIFESHIK